MIDLDVNSMYSHNLCKEMLTPTVPFEKVDEAVVDGVLWHTVRVRRQSSGICPWLRSHGADELTTGWAFDTFFDVPDELFTLMSLRWA